MEKPTLDKFPRSVLANTDIQRAFIISRLIVAAERLQIFRALHDRHLAADAIGRALKIHQRYLQPFLNSLVSLGLLRRTGDMYGNTRFAKKYFIDERSIYWTRQYSKECVDDYDALSGLERALTSGRRYGSPALRNKPNYLERMTRDRREAEDFTQMLFYLHQGEAEALANYLDLADHRAVLDVGGGSGVMSIALARKHPHLRGCVLDIAPVCRIAARNVRRAGLSQRIRSQAGDIHDRLPPGYDVVMFCDVGAISMDMLKNAYRALPPKGMLVLVDRYLADDGTKPLDRLVNHFVGSSFGLATRRSMVEAVKACGFHPVKSKKVYQDVWCVTGTKAGQGGTSRLS